MNEVSIHTIELYTDQLLKKYKKQGKKPLDKRIEALFNAIYEVPEKVCDATSDATDDATDDATNDATDDVTSDVTSDATLWDKLKEVPKDRRPKVSSISSRPVLRVKQSSIMPMLKSRRPPSIWKKS